MSYSRKDIPVTCIACLILVMKFQILLRVYYWNASSLLVEHFGKQDLREVVFKIILLSPCSGSGTDLGTGDSAGKKCKGLVKALISGLDDWCVIQIASVHSIRFNRPT